MMAIRGWHSCVISTARPELWLAEGVEGRLELASTSQLRWIFFLMGPKSGWKKERLCDRLWFESPEPEMQFRCILRADFADGVHKRSRINDPGTEILFENEQRIVKVLGFRRFSGRSGHFILWTVLKCRIWFSFSSNLSIRFVYLSIHNLFCLSIGGEGKLEPIAADFRWEAGNAPGRKLEHPEGTHAGKGRTWERPQLVTRYKPVIFSLTAAPPAQLCHPSPNSQHLYHVVVRFDHVALSELSVMLAGGIGTHSDFIYIDDPYASYRKVGQAWNRNVPWRRSTVDPALLRVFVYIITNIIVYLFI